jgi:hypothetical protein
VNRESSLQDSGAPTDGIEVLENQLAASSKL